MGVPELENTPHASQFAPALPARRQDEPPPYLPVDAPHPQSTPNVAPNAQSPVQSFPSQNFLPHSPLQSQSQSQLQNYFNVYSSVPSSSAGIYAPGPTPPASYGSNNNYNNNGGEWPDEKRRPSMPVSVVSGFESNEADLPATAERVEIAHDIEIRGENPWTRAKRLYGNPLAKDHDWTVTEEDWNRHDLPSYDVLLRMKHSLKSSPSPVNGYRVSFSRDPRRNPRFDPGLRFTPIMIGNKSKSSKFAGTGFERGYEGAIMAAHDVSSADWGQFLEDIATAGTMAAGSVPLGVNIGNVPLPFMKAMGNSVQQMSEPRVMAVLAEWQARFFSQRGVEISIDSAGTVHLNSDTSSASDSDTPEYRALDRKARKKLRKERKFARKHRRQERHIENKRQKLLTTRYGRVRLIVSPILMAGVGPTQEKQPESVMPEKKEKKGFWG